MLLCIDLQHSLPTRFPACRRINSDQATPSLSTHHHQQVISITTIYQGSAPGYHLPILHHSTTPRHPLSAWLLLPLSFPRSLLVAVVLFSKLLPPFLRISDSLLAKPPPVFTKGRSATRHIQHNSRPHTHTRLTHTTRTSIHADGDIRVWEDIH
ncbi:hypothetical protein EDB80DRAFT_311431 [Ilyonectria destructans]|nr:hypothetical protein EDB80DRAFT_311431 [Ilyonectria destructans]